MKMNKYVVKNLVNGLVNQIVLCRTDAEMSRNVTAEFGRVPSDKQTFTLNDFQILRIGTFDTETLEESIDDVPTVVSFDNRFLSEHNGSADTSEVVNDIMSVR